MDSQQRNLLPHGTTRHMKKEKTSFVEANLGAAVETLNRIMSLYLYPMFFGGKNTESPSKLKMIS